MTWGYQSIRYSATDEQASPPYSTLIGSKSNIALFRSDVPVPYPEAIAWMEQQVAGIATGRAEEALWFLSTRRCTPPAPAPNNPTFYSPTGFQYTTSVEAVNTPITGPVSALSMC